MAGRVSQTVAEAEAVGDPNARASQIVTEAQGLGSPTARASQVVAEAHGLGSPVARASQLVTEAQIRADVHARASQLVVELLIRRIPLAQPPIYPDLPGLTFPIVWRPKFPVQSEVAANMAEVDAALADSPVHEFDIPYSVLRNGWGPGSTEFKTMFGFYGRMFGPFGRCLFRNPKDNAVVGQALGTTDGTSSTYGPMARTFGVGDNSFTEPVGYIDLTQPVKIYLGGVQQDETSYSILTDSPMNQQVRFNSTPSADQDITGDFSFFYYCKLAEAAPEFSEFMENLFELGKVTLRSCRQGT